MKTRKLFKALCIALFATAGMSACTNDDGDWGAMKWDTEVKMGKQHVISVPKEGGEYVFTCRNYSFWIEYMQEGTFITDCYAPTGSGKWSKAIVGGAGLTKGRVMTVTIASNTGKDSRVMMVVVTAGDVFDDFTFKQEAGNPEQ